MPRKRVLLTCLESFLLLTAIFTFLSRKNVSYGLVLNVPDPYPTIQAAITAASAGDTINVSRRLGETQSVYFEKLVINKQLTLVGEGRETVIIDGSGTGTVIRVQADNVEIRGFTIRNGGSSYSGVRANGFSYMTLADNMFETNKYGISLLYSHYNTIIQNLIINNNAASVSLSESIGNNISNNNIAHSAFGIKFSSTNATFVVNNTVTDVSYGIYLEASSNDTVDRNTLLRIGVDGLYPYESHNVVISNNKVTECAYAIQLYSSNAITVLANNATDNSYGIYLAYSGPSNIVANNTLSKNDWGISLYSSSGNTASGNTLSYNTYGVNPAANSNNNLFFHNNFMDNIEQAVWNPDCSNVWDDGYPSGGNFWSDYTGADSNGDGIGDTPYSIDPMNQDRYPLMTPWFSDVAIIDLAVSAPAIYVGETVNITVMTENQGTLIETFNITVKYENTTLGILETIGTQQIIDLAPGQSSNVTFMWNTLDVPPCMNYTIIAEASVLPGESDIADNTYIDGKVQVKILGDVNGDGVVDVYDLSIVSLAYGTFEGQPRYNPDADINHDGIVDLRDIAVVTMNYGHTNP